MKKFNINDTVKVKLTPHGADIFYHKFDEANKKIVARGGKPLEPMMPQIDKDGFTEFQLWCFIELYGNYIGVAKESVISDICLYIDDENLKEVN